MISWIRIARGIGDDPKVHAIADQVGADIVAVVGHLVLLFGEMAEHAKDGDLRAVPDSALERWAGWTGKRGKFAAAFRQQLTTDGVVSAWEKHNGAAIQKAEADAERLRNRRRGVAGASRDGRATDARAPGDGRAGVDGRRDETRRNEELNGKHPPTQTTPSPRAPDAPAAAEPEGFAAAWAAFPAREGSNPRRDAARAYRARLREGHPAAVLVAGAERYAAWCEAEGKVGTPYVLQAATFFGPSLRFLEPWPIAVAAGPLLGPVNGWMPPTLDAASRP